MKTSIIFTSDSVAKIMSGRKTQTRRVILPQPTFFSEAGWPLGKLATEKLPGGGTQSRHVPLARPYAPEVWVREKWAVAFGKIEYGDSPTYTGPWTSPMYMPKSASRLSIAITACRCERLQQISEADAVAEGCQPWIKDGQMVDTAVSDFAQLWNSINLPRGWGWAVNPWVWVLELKCAKI